MAEEGDCRYLSRNEMERMQGVRENYTRSVTRNQAAGLLGDGWTVDVISHIFSSLSLNKTKEDLE